MYLSVYSGYNSRVFIIKGERNMTHTSLWAAIDKIATVYSKKKVEQKQTSKLPETDRVRN